MKTIATIQYIIAWICTLVFALPTTMLLSSPLPILVMIGVWLYGLWLLRGYGRVMSGSLSATQTQNLWLASLAFNAVGLLIGAIVGNGEGSLEGYLVLLPALTGTVLAFVALLLPADQTSRLETNTQVHS